MGDHQERRAGVADEAQEQVEHGVAGRLVEVAGGFVGQHEFRPGGEGAADGDALLLAAGELFGVAGQKCVQPKTVSELRGVVRVVSTGEPGLEGEVGGHVERGDQVELLEDQADRAPAQRGAGGVVGGRDLGSVEQDVPRVRCVETRNQMKKRAFSAAGLARERQAFARVEREVDAVEHAERAFAGAA